MKIILFILILAVLPSIVLAETTFFDQDDTFIMGPAGEQGSPPPVSESPTSGSGGGSCRYAWNCTGWNICVSGKQNRTCLNLGSCADEFNPPIREQNCTFLLSGIILSWQKGEFDQKEPESGEGKEEALLPDERDASEGSEEGANKEVMEERKLFPKVIIYIATALAVILVAVLARKLVRKLRKG